MVNSTATLVIPAVFAASGTLNTTATASSGLAVGKLVDLQDGKNEVIGLLTAVASTSIAFIVLEVRQGAVGNTLASGARVQLGYTSNGAVLKSTDIDWSTYAANLALVAVASNGFPFSFGAAGAVSGAAGAESQAIGNMIVKKGLKTLVPADGASDPTVTFAAAFPTSLDFGPFLQVDSHTSVTLKVLQATPNTKGAASFKIHLVGGDASSTASVSWLAFGH